VALTITEDATANTYAEILALADPNALVPNKMFQRRLGSQVGDLVFSGTYTGSPSAIHCRIKRKHDNTVIKDWTALTSATIAGGNWTGTLVGVPQSKPSEGDATYGSAYYLEVSEDAGSSVADTSDVYFRVGICMIIAGQSLAQGVVASGDAVATYPYTAPTAHRDEWFFNHQQNAVFTSTDAWTYNSGFAQAREILRLVRQAEDCAVSFTAWIQAAAPSYYWIDGWAVDQANNPAGQTILDTYGGAIEFILWNQGESDSTIKWYFGYDLTDTKYYLYADRMNELHTTWTTYLGKTVSDIPWLVASLGASRVSSSPGEAEEPNDLVLALAQTREEQQIAHDRYPNIHCIGAQVGETMVDTIHLVALAYGNVAKRYGQGICSLLGHGSMCTPKITSAAVVDARTTYATVTHGTGTDIAGKASATDYTGFQVWNGERWVSAVGNRVNATTIAVTTSEDVTTTSARRLGYARTSLGASTNPVIDNGTPFGTLMATGVMGIEVTGTHNVAVPQFVGGLAHRLSIDWAFATKMQVPATWTPLYLGPVTTSDRLLIILLVDPNGSNAAYNVSITVGQDAGSDVVATAVSRQARISLFTAEVSGSSTEIEITASRANSSSENFDMCIFQVPVDRLTTTTVSLSYTSVTNQTSATLALDVGAHDAVVGIASVTSNTGNSYIEPFDSAEAGYQVLGVGAIIAMMPFLRTDAQADASHQLVFENYNSSGTPTALTFGLGAVVLESVYVEVESDAEPEVEQPSGAGKGKRKRKLYTFPDGTIGYATDQEAAAIVAEIPRTFGKPEVPKAEPIKISRNVEVARQQLSDLLPKLQSLDSEPARREATRLIRKMEEVQKRIDELEEEEIVMLITLLH
jgi:hypothetical protein